jgi:dihydroorotate dehydrogenase (NAD+) catalytic subunit
MPWRRPRKTEHRGGRIRRSEEEALEAAQDDEELAQSVELAELEGASLGEVALGGPEEGVERSPLADKLASALRGVELPEERIASPLPARRRPRSSSATDAPAPAPPSIAPFPIAALDVVDVDLAVSIGSLHLRNPVMPASGCFGWGRDYEEIFAPSLLGAIVTKGTTPKARPGNRQYRIAETPSGILNSIGLENPGAEGVAKKYAPLWRDIGAPVIVNVAGYSVADYVFVVRALDGLPGVAAFELNVSCPNVDGGMLFGCDPDLAAEVTGAVKSETDLPLIVKLTPNAPDPIAVAQAIEEAGADALTCMNTILGMRIDPQRRKPILGTSAGGLSGPAVRPIAVHLTYQIAQRVRIPILGAGGVTNARDALEFLMAGATAVQVGTATFADPLAPVKVIQGLAAYARENSLASIRDIIGAALPKRTDDSAPTEYVD